VRKPSLKFFVVQSSPSRDGDRVTIRKRTPHATLDFLCIADVARELGVSRWTAQRMAAAGRIPGAERMYDTDRGTRYHVHAETFRNWRQAVQEREAG
jgi:hypothetical protein